MTKLARRANGYTEKTKMIKLIAVAFALVAATSAHAMSPAPLHQPDGMITQVREGCGVGRVRINGICVARTTRRHVRREARRQTFGISPRAIPHLPRTPAPAGY